MGLTIHFSLALPGKMPVEKVKAKLEQLRQRCLDLPVKEVDPTLLDLKGKECAHERITSLRDAKSPDQQRLLYFLLSAQAIIGYQLDGNGRPQEVELGKAQQMVFVQPRRLIGFTMFPGPGCEPMRVKLARFPKGIMVKGDPTKGSRRFLLPLKNADKWLWMGFCKTQYASQSKEGGLENFLRCHLSIIAVLDYAKEIGFEITVTDEGGFWEKRDIQSLCKDLENYNELVAGFGGLLKDATETEGDVKIQGPIFGNPEFERLEAKGRAKLAPKIDPKLFELIKTVIKHEKQAGQ